MNAEDRQVIRSLTQEIRETNKEVNGLRTDFTDHKATINETLKTYPDLKEQVFTNKEDISNGKTTLKVLSWVLGIVLLGLGTFGAIGFFG